MIFEKMTFKATARTSTNVSSMLKLISLYSIAKISVDCYPNICTDFILRFTRSHPSLVCSTNYQTSRKKKIYIYIFLKKYIYIYIYIYIYNHSINLKPCQTLTNSFFAAHALQKYCQAFLDKRRESSLRRGREIGGTSAKLKKQRTRS